MREDAQQRATEFLKELYATGDIDASGFDTGVTGLLAAKTEAELAEVVRFNIPGGGEGKNSTRSGVYGHDLLH